jgi:glycosyltransferase A (GT-A) superfamily protein (DUF2064 family)
VNLATAIVIAKQPLPGRVKTRLVPPLTHAEAAHVAAAAIRDTLRAVDAVGARHRLLAFDGHPEAWLPTGWRACRQPEGELDRRLVAAFAAASRGPAVLVGMDTPQLRPGQLSFDPGRYDACLGPATDGGYWAIGFTDPRVAAAAISGIPMSRHDTGARQLARLYALGLRVQVLDELTDVDTVDAAVAVAEVAPRTEFAREFRRAACIAGVR